MNNQRLNSKGRKALYDLLVIQWQDMTQRFGENKQHDKSCPVCHGESLRCSNPWILIYRIAISAILEQEAGVTFEELWHSRQAESKQIIQTHWK